jgi:hypothetical protein
MAKEEVHNWLRTMVLLGGIFVTLGGGWKMIDTNQRDIAENRDELNKHDDEIHTLQLNNKDMQNLSTATLAMLEKMEGRAAAANEMLIQMRIDMTQMKSQLNNLEGVDDGQGS